MTAEYLDGWHFVAATLRGGAPLPERGDVLPRLAGMVPCKKGMYHLSERALDALDYAPGPRVARVRLRYHLIEHGGNKWAGQQRENLTNYVDASLALSKFARYAARRVSHLWDPDPVVLRWLWTGDESARASARDSARVSAWVSTRVSTWDSSWVSSWADLNIALEGYLWEALR